MGQGNGDGIIVSPTPVRLGFLTVNERPAAVAVLNPCVIEGTPAFRESLQQEPMLEPYMLELNETRVGFPLLLWFRIPAEVVGPQPSRRRVYWLSP